MVNTFEAVGIAVSIGAMALALWFIRLETVNNTVVSEVSGTTNAGAVYVAEGDNQRAALADAYIDASGGVGDIERMIIDDVVIGSGDVAEEGDTVTVHYIGSLQTGEQFDNSYAKGAPFTFTIGEGRVIKGWEDGLVGMRVGGQRILVIPPELGYGRDGFGPIPKNATLVFAIELLSVEK